jgi:hypothetical protein
MVLSIRPLAVVSLRILCVYSMVRATEFEPLSAGTEWTDLCVDMRTEGILVC